MGSSNLAPTSFDRPKSPVVIFLSHRFLHIFLQPNKNTSRSRSLPLHSTTLHIFSPLPLHNRSHPPHPPHPLAPSRRSRRPRVGSPDPRSGSPPQGHRPQTRLGLSVRGSRRALGNKQPAVRCVGGGLGGGSGLGLVQVAKSRRCSVGKRKKERGSMMSSPKSTLA